MEQTISNQPTVTDSDILCDRKFMFSNHKGEYKKRIQKKQTKLLKKISFLKNFLDDDERVLLITTGCSPVSILEQLVTGWMFIYLKRSLFVFTNKRIFHIPTKFDFSYRNSIAQIKYSDCTSVQLKWSKLIANYKNGTKEIFLYIKSSERKKIKLLLNNVSFEGSASKYPKRTHLCPRCATELEDGNYTCPKCKLEFKNKDVGRKVSIIFPGGGYFYTRHPFLGIGDAITETFLIFFVIISLFSFLNNDPESIIILVIFSIFLVIEKFVSIYHSNHFIKEFIPKEKDIKPIT